MSVSQHDGYKLRATLIGHSGDVRTLTTAKLGTEAIISGSRDKTSCVWMLEGEKFNRAFCFKGHEKYVSSVAWIPGSAQHSQGLILTGGLDKIVNVYDPLSASPSMPVYSLSGHKDAVSCMASHQSGLVLTGSWDCTAKLWADSFCLVTLEGHQMAIWAVEFVKTSTGDGDLFLATASADKTVRIWSKTGEAAKTLTGHTDAVRGLVSPGPNRLLSCANDAVIRQWDVLTGTCLTVYYGHSNYIYDIALLGGDGFVTCGEDCSVRVWNMNSADSVQTIRLPARSIWSVTALENGDIVAGGSDSHIRIFTRDAGRIAPADQIKSFDEEVASMEHSTKEVLEGVKTEDLPTESALFAPGEKDGQTKIIRKGTQVEVYNWSGLEKAWKKIGDVVGSSGGSEKTSGRTLHQGKEYDFVFNVDFDESKPPVKLPYNRSDDPWHVAQQFLNDNELPQSYLDTVAKFITQNVPDAGASAPVSTYVDPFTGGGRYMPGAASGHIGGGGGGSATSYRDPFTGAGAYVSGGGSAAPKSNGAGPAGEPTAVSVYPVRDYIGFHAGNVDGILKKLKENMEKSGITMDEADLEDFRKLMQKDVSPQQVSFSTLNSLGKILDLDEGKIFPALDLLRFAIRHKDVCDYFCGAERSAYFIQFLLPFVKSTTASAANQQLALKILSNIFLGGPSGLSMLSTNQKSLLTTLTESASGSQDKAVQSGRATILLNYSVLCCARGTAEERLELLYVVMEIAKTPNAVTDDEAVFRVLSAIGTLLSGAAGGGGEEVKGYAKALDVIPFGQVVASGSQDERVRAIWKALERDLSQP